MEHQGWLLLHIAGVLLFFSNAVAALFWRVRAERSGDPRLLAFAYRCLMQGDAWLTPASVVAIVVSGIALARFLRLPILGTPWVLWSLIAFAGSGLLFALRVLPLQSRLAQEAEQAVVSGSFDVARHRLLAARWAFWAHLSLLAAALAVVLMVLKPAL